MSSHYKRDNTMIPTRIIHARSYLVLLTLVSGLLAGCAEYSTAPLRLEQDFGNSVRQMQAAQTLNAKKASDPALVEPVKTFDGKKGEAVLDKAYRKDVAKPQEVKQDIIFNIGGGG